MKIVHVVVTGTFAGTERYVSLVGRELAARGHEIVVVGGDPVRARNTVEIFGRWLPGSTLAAAARSLLSLKGTDIVHAHLTAAELIAVPTAKLLRARVISTRHIAAPRGSSAPAHIVGKVAARGLALQLAISDFVADRVEPPSQVLHNGVENQPLKTPGNRVVLVAQRLEAEKSTALAIAAWDASGLGARGWRMRIAGQGSEWNALREAVVNSPARDSIDLLGQVEDIGAEMQQASILLATAPAEPLGLSVLEAMAIGLPVVAAAGGGHLETVGTVSPDHLFPPGDAESAGRILQALADDEPAREHYGQDLRLTQQRQFSLSQHVDSLVDCYRQVL